MSYGLLYLIIGLPVAFGWRLMEAKKLSVGFLLATWLLWPAPLLAMTLCLGEYLLKKEI